MKILYALRFVFLIVAGPTQASAAQVNASDKTAIQNIVRQYILENPEIITEALKTLQERERLTQEKIQRKALQNSAAQLYENPMTPEYSNPQ